MRLAVFSHKPCWTSPDSPSGFATDGGFPMQMRAISELFDETILLVPCESEARARGEMPLTGCNLRIQPLRPLRGTGIWRKAALPGWLLMNAPRILRAFRQADAVHAPIPGDVGTIGMLLAQFARKPLFVRHCGNWANTRTVAERFWRHFMEHYAGGRTVVLATGGASEPPSAKNPDVRWIFSTSMTADELAACGRARDLPEHDPRLIIACRQEWAKGADKVIQSLPVVRQRIGSIWLDVVGDGAALAGLRQLARDCGVADRTCFYGKADHGRVLELLQRADLFVFPTSSSEGFPKGVLEALACGLPVVTTRVSVLPTLLENGCGFLLDDSRPECIARTIVRCLTDRRQYRIMSGNALATAANYSLEKWRDTVGDLLTHAWGPLKEKNGSQPR